MGQNEAGLVGCPEITGHRQHRFALYFVTEDRDGKEVAAKRHLARVKQGAARDREAVQARLTAPASESRGSPTVVDDRATAFRAERIAVVARPPDLAEDGLGFLIRHAR